MELTQVQYDKIKSFIAPTGLTTTQARLRSLAFDLAIRNHLGFERWENVAEKRGFSGITLSAPTSISPANLEIIWTDDGVIGHPMQLDGTMRESLKAWMEGYNG